MAAKMADLTGQKFHRLTVIRFVSKRNSQHMWECICECGTIKVFASGNFKRKTPISCGCLRSENAKRTSKINCDTTTHGKSRTSEYGIWLQMRKRCNNVKDKYYHVYGGRGIRVCDRWINSFENFIEDIGERPSLKYSLDRFPNKNGNYEPENCRWATMKEQQNNRTNNRIIEFNGVSLNLTQWSEKLGLKKTTLRERLDRRHYSIEKALTKTVKYGTNAK